LAWRFENNLSIKAGYQHFMVALFFTSLPFHLPPIKSFVREQASIPDLFTHFEDKHKPINIPNL